MKAFELDSSQRTGGTTPSGLLQDFLRPVVYRHRDNLAIDVPSAPNRPARQSMTYGELDDLSARLARQLLPMVKGETIFVLMIPRTTPLLYAAQLAVLKAGGAFTCIDPSFPDDRIREIVADAEPGAMLASSDTLFRLAELELGATPLLDVEALAATETAIGPLPADIPSDRLAYVIYTSGTTGKPKGVQIEHRNIANLVASDIVEFALGPLDRVVQGSSSAYDSSLEETWLALSSGATLVVMDDAAARLGPDLVGWLQTEQITVFCPPPTLLRSSGCADPAHALPDLRLLYVGGEALPADIADRWSRGRRMVNGYGPTECAVTCIRGDIVAGRDIGIGRAIPGMNGWVLDEELVECATGQRGELCIGGAGVARGYRNAPDLTVEKFIDHPLHGRLYRTGDLVHVNDAGEFFYHGRIDAQVKIRGYRVELGEIDSRLAALDGVRAGACKLQAAGAGSELVGYAIASDPQSPPDPERLRTMLRQVLPAYMVPVRIGLLPDLPTTVGGKLDRAKLPDLALSPSGEDAPVASPANELEAFLADAVGDILHRPAPVSVEADFFADLGGDSLSAALLVTLLREDPRGQWVTVSDIYEARSVRALAGMAHALLADEREVPAELTLPRTGEMRPVLANIVQIGWLSCELFAAAWLGWLMAFKVLPILFADLSLTGFILLTPLLAAATLAIYVPASILFAVAVKRLVIGTYQPVRTAVWSSLYLRHWVVVQACRLIPWPLLQGTALQQSILRALGARIGRGVHIHRGVDLARGGWDLLDLGDGVSLGQDVEVGLVELDRGDIVVAPVALAAGVTLETRAGIGGWCRMGSNSVLTSLSNLNPGTEVADGEVWDGVPARKAGLAAPAPRTTTASREIAPWQFDLAASVAEGTLGFAAAIPGMLLALAACRITGTGIDEIWRWTYHPSFTTRAGILVLLLTVVSVPLTLFWGALLMRAMGPVRPGIYPRWSLGYLRAWLKAGMLRLAGEWLTGTIFWPHWLRLAGMRIGPKCEISTIIDVVPELVEIGAETFFADGIYLGGADVRHGTARLGMTRLGRGTFLGNHVVVPPGEQLPDNILVGISTRADAGEIASGEARFGHPSFDLPRREVISVDRSLTHDPSPIRYWNRMFWELLRFTLPILPMVLTALWYVILVEEEARVSVLDYDLLVVPSAALFPLVVLCAGVLILKWTLIGRVKPGQHPLWSCWCSRWDFVYVAWARWATKILRRLDGTYALPVYLRAMGLKIGRRAVLGPQFAQVVDPDMIEIGDDATVTAMFQAHTFEDRVLKVGKVRIGAGATVARGTVPLYGAVVGEGAHVGPHSVIMKQEHLLPGLRYQGVPTRVLGTELGTTPEVSG